MSICSNRQVVTIMTLLLFAAAMSCTNQAGPTDAKGDPHSFARPDEAVMTHLDWNAAVDFDQALTFAKYTADHLGVNLEIVKIDYSDLQNDIKKMIYHLDEPLADPAALNLYFMSQAAKNMGIKVEV